MAGPELAEEVLRMTKNTADKLTRAHYRTPAIREIITRHALIDSGWRALNGDFWIWYRHEGKGVRLFNVVKDYDYLTTNFRTLYWTLNIFDEALYNASPRPRQDITPKSPLGTPADTVAYMLSVDIDKGAGHEIEEPEAHAAVEAAAQYFIDYLKEHGVHESVWALFSGGGCYVHIHHEVCRPGPQATREDRSEFFTTATGCFNRLIERISEAFFEDYPEYIGLVKFDPLNNSKRIFKSLLSVHKKKLYAVTPISRDAIKIDFARASLPLKDDMIAEAGAWYSTFDPNEREALFKLLDEFRASEQEASHARHFKETWVSPREMETHAPCIRHVLETENKGAGKTRFAGFLSAYLYQAGLSEADAWEQVEKVSNRNGVQNARHIFESYYGRLSCPSCLTIQNDGTGFPHLGLKGLGVCKPDEICNGCQWPGDYERQKALVEMHLEDGPVLPAWLFLKLEQLTKATGKMEEIDPETGDNVLDENSKPKIIPKRTLSPTKASAAMAEVMELRISDADTGDKQKLWRYNGGIWQPDGEREIIKAIDAIIGDLSYDKGLRETLRRIRSHSPTVAFDGNPHLFPALDGVVDLATGMFREARPEDYLTFQYGAAYNVPGADYREFLWFLATSLPDPRDCLTVIDIITAIAIRIPFDTIVLLFGGGANGKGILEKIIIALFLMSRVASITLEEMKRSRFGPGALLGKDVWVISEVEGVKDAISVLKKVSTGELLDADVKYGARVQGVPHLLPILDCNNAFDFGDDSHGRKRRVVKLDFPYTFDYGEADRPKDPHLREKLTRPEVLAGIGHIVAARAPSMIRSQRIFNRKSAAEMAEEYRRQQYHLTTFFDDCVEGAAGMELLTTVCYDEYREYCRLFNVPTPTSPSPFGKYIKERYGVSSEVRGSKRYYPGLTLKAQANTVFAENKIEYHPNSGNTDKMGVNWQNTAEDRRYTALATAYLGKTNNSKEIATGATGDLLSKVIQELLRMYEYISKWDVCPCLRKRYLLYEVYLNSPVFPVSPVAEPRSIPISDKSPVASPVEAPVAITGKETSVGKIEAELQQAEERRAAKEAHDAIPAPAQVTASDTPVATIQAPKTTDPGLKKFKTGMRKRHCINCGKNFNHDLSIHYKNGFICWDCKDLVRA